tara:strand:+ start:157 stop:1152 length:996 start_codon:yes stop_codon:yes gene_type:complete
MNEHKGKIVVTGGLGFIGHNLCIALQNIGYDLFIVDNRSHNTTKPWHRIIVDQRLQLIDEAGIPIIVNDTTNEFPLEKTLIDIKPDKIIHTAAMPDAGLSNRDPSAGFNQNLLSTKILLEIIRKNELSISQFTFLSSSMIYGDFVSESVDEDSPKEPKGIYGAAKLSSELLIKAYHNLIDLPYTIIRPSALYGPRCINNRVTQIFIERALKGDPIIIQGDGSQKLDFTFIDDFVGGIVLTQTHPDAINGTFNLTTGHAEPIGKLATILKKYFPGLEVNYESWADIIPVRGTLNIDRIKQLGFEPQYNIETGYPKYIEWYLENNDSFKIGVK